MRKEFSLALVAALAGAVCAPTLADELLEPGGYCEVDVGMGAGGRIEETKKTIESQTFLGNTQTITTIEGGDGSFKQEFRNEFDPGIKLKFGGRDGGIEIDTDRMFSNYKQATRELGGGCANMKGQVAEQQESK